MEWLRRDDDGTGAEPSASSGERTVRLAAGLRWQRYEGRIAYDLHSAFTSRRIKSVMSS
jgi:hypothetical protein